jgi:two-component system sensor histidine kinase YesM
MYGLILLLLKRVSRAIETSVLTPIKSICTSTEFIGKGEFVTIPMAHYDIEVGILAESINRMSLEIKRLLETTKNEQEQLKRTELQLYQSQINPHFLYNTLDTIVALVESSLESDAVMLIERLSDFFRTSLSGGRSKISIKDEINHVRSYLEIQKVRYQDIMEYHIDLDQAIENFQIIKLTLQPLVENALYHGIKQRRGVGHITITGRMKERNTLSFTVQDDGIGMEEKKVEALRHYINTPTIQNAQTFGLHNVNQRLILNYGKEYGLTIESAKSKGTIVTVLIPIEEDKQER